LPPGKYAPATAGKTLAKTIKTIMDDRTATKDAIKDKASAVERSV